MIQNYLTNFMHLSDPAQLAQLLPGAIEHPSVHIYWKDNKGIYQGCNDAQAKNTGFEKGDQLLGLTDYDLSLACFAAEIEKNDKKVLLTGKATSLLEPFRSHDNKDYQFFSLKTPLLNHMKKTIGVIGLSININEIYRPSFPTAIEPTSISTLSERQKQCLYYLVKGMTLKEISATLQLSPRTVEHYIEAIKRKLNCNSRSELIMKVTNGS